jgi:hypothetical protein
MVLIRACRLDRLRSIEDILAQLSGIQKTNPPLNHKSKQPPVLSPKQPPGDQDRHEPQKTADKKTGPLEKKGPLQAIPITEPTKKAAGGDPSTSADQILKLWEETILKIKEARPSLGSYLEQGVVTNATPERITLGYPEHAGFLTDLISKPDSQQFIDAALSKMFLKPPRLEIRPGAVPVLAGKTDQNLKNQQASQSSDEEPVGPVTEENLSAHPHVQEILQIFGGRVIELKKEEG